MPLWKDGTLQGGAPEAHGSTHAFGASDEVPGGEQIESVYTCTAAEQVGDVVYLHATGEVRRALADAVATMPAEGIIKSKPGGPTGTTCVIVGDGEIGAFVGLTPDAVYFVSDSAAGAITTTPPTTSGHVVQSVGRAITTSVLYVQRSLPVLR